MTFMYIKTISKQKQDKQIQQEIQIRYYGVEQTRNSL